MNQQVYISYNWQEDSNEMANQLVQAFAAKGIEIIRDKTHTSYKDSIKNFMRQIGQGKCVVAVISDRYLKSENCMFELVEIARNGDFYQRIFPIILPDARIHKDFERIDYLKYWEGEKAKLQAKYKQIEESEVRFEKIDCDDAEYLFVAYGTSARICQKVVKMARAKGIKIGLFRPITLWPYPTKELNRLSENIRGILSVEMSAGQMIEDVKLAVGNDIKVEHYGRFGGMIPSPNEVLNAFEEKFIKK